MSDPLLFVVKHVWSHFLSQNPLPIGFKDKTSLIHLLQSQSFIDADAEHQKWLYGIPGIPPHTPPIATGDADHSKKIYGCLNEGPVTFSELSTLMNLLFGLPPSSPTTLQYVSNISTKEMLDPNPPSFTSFRSHGLGSIQKIFQNPPMRSYLTPSFGLMSRSPSASPIVRMTKILTTLVY